MALNQDKLIKLIIEEAGKLPERCDGYRTEVINTITEVITLERQHRREGINIKIKIADQCSALGQILAKRKQD
jgi:hypothetical protein